MYLLITFVNYIKRTSSAKPVHIILECYDRKLFLCTSVRSDKVNARYVIQGYDLK